MKFPRYLFPIFILFIAIIFSGCVEQIEQTQSETVLNDAVVPEYAPVVDLAKKDLSEKLNIPIGDIKLVKEESIDWRDSSLGYPEEGMKYAQVITPGFRITLKAGDKIYEYHSDYKRIAGPKEV
ncbi:MAG: hypothetical protein WC556_06630 [Candidatus Methanoperedens sp.]